MAIHADCTRSINIQTIKKVHVNAVVKFLGLQHKDALLSNHFISTNIKIIIIILNQFDVFD